MTSFKTKQPLPMFLIDLTAGPNNDSILEVDGVGFKIKFEKYRKSRVPPQCSNCQKYYHTAGNCRTPTRCRNCAGSHQTKSCSVSSPKCCLCSEEHRANYKGCKVYKDLCKNRKQESKSPGPLVRGQPSAQGIRQAKPPPKQRNINVQNNDKPRIAQSVAPEHDKAIQTEAIQVNSVGVKAVTKASMIKTIAAKITSSTELLNVQLMLLPLQGLNCLFDI